MIIIVSSYSYRTDTVTYMAGGDQWYVTFQSEGENQRMKIDGNCNQKKTHRSVTDQLRIPLVIKQLVFWSFILISLTGENGRAGDDFRGVELPHIDGIIEQMRPKVAPVDGVEDPVLGYLIALLEADVLDTLSGVDILRNSEQQNRKSIIPIQSLTIMGRNVGADSTRRHVFGRFSRKIRIPSPYSLLGYHPGDLVLSQEIRLTEKYFGNFTIWERKKRKRIDIDDCTVWFITGGSVRVDVDGWIDFMFGGKLDDSDVNSLALFTYDGKRFASAMGYNESGKGRTGVLDLSTNEFVFPLGWRYKAIGRFLRRKAELMVE